MCCAAAVAEGEEEEERGGESAINEAVLRWCTSQQGVFCSTFTATRYVCKHAEVRSSQFWPGSTLLTTGPRVDRAHPAVASWLFVRAHPLAVCLFLFVFCMHVCFVVCCFFVWLYVSLFVLFAFFALFLRLCMVAVEEGIFRNDDWLYFALLFSFKRSPVSRCRCRCAAPFRRIALPCRVVIGRNRFKRMTCSWSKGGTPLA